MQLKRFCIDKPSQIAIKALNSIYPDSKKPMTEKNFRKRFEKSTRLDINVMKKLEHILKGHVRRTL